MSSSGIVNVRMVITEEKILSNIEKVQKLINPKSKKQIVQLDDDTYFKDLVESIKTYLIEYPKKKNFPSSVYKASYGLVEYATNQFEENTKKIEKLIRQREENIAKAGNLKELIESVENKENDWEIKVQEAGEIFGDDIVETLNIVGQSKDNSLENYQDAMKLLNARVNNLESNLHIEIDMERIEDRSKALSYIGIEIADALKSIPAPVEEIIQEQPIVQEEVQAPMLPLEPQEEPQIQQQIQPQVQEQQYFEQTTFETKPSLWQRFKKSKFVRAFKAITRIRIVIEPEALPEGRGENY